MFGIGKLIGGALEAVGLGKIAPFVSLAANVFTGNWAGVATDVMGLVSKFSDSSFLNNVSKQAPVGGFSSGNKIGGGIIGNLLKGKIGGIINTFGKAFGAFKDLQSGNFKGAFGKAFDCFTTIKGFVDNQQTLTETLRYTRTANLQG